MDQNALATVVIFAVNAVISAIAGIVAASLWVGEYKNRVRSLETTVGIDEHNGLRKTVGDIRDKVIACETSLKEREPLTKRKSPVSLTERGTLFLQNSGGKKFVDDNFNELLEKVDQLEPKTAYDVQEDAKKIVEGLKEDERLNPIKEFLFKDGSTWDDVATVMGVYLRDRILLHKNWNAEEIDLHGVDITEPSI